MGVGALVALGVALVSPLEAMAADLASAHMVQHVLLVLVAAPLLVLAAPSGWRFPGVERHPVLWWLLHTGTLWFWHAAGPYGAALEHLGLHVVEHASFLLTGALFWHAVIGARARRSPDGMSILLVFAMALQSGFLSLLLTFAPSPWYAGYASTTQAWGLTPLADQQLAGVIMWIPAGLVYVGAGIALLVAWLHAAEQSLSPPPVLRLAGVAERRSETGERMGSHLLHPGKDDQQDQAYRERAQAIHGEVDDVSS